MISQTRSDNNENLDFIKVMLNPTADFGGLYTFDKITPFSDDELANILKLDYKNMAIEIFKKLDINIDKDLLKYALDSYDVFNNENSANNNQKNSNHTITPLIKIKDNLFCLELYHGPTFAFKDMALMPFARILEKIASKNNQKYLILSATSGDTGPATLEAFNKAQNIKTICIYPASGTSEIQKLQMTTQDSENIKVFAINGNFDDAQTTLKTLLQDNDFKERLAQKGFNLSAANSVNLARIAFQIIYYFEIAKELKKHSIDIFDIYVPSGNFGNAFGGFLAKTLGVKINKIAIATNPNDVLHEFFSKGIYDIRNRELILSNSPAMDILKSSNIERLLYFYFGHKNTKDFMRSLNEDGYFALNKEQLQVLKKDFISHNFSDDECLNGIKKCFIENKYVIDPHTSNAFLFANMESKNDKNANSNSTDSQNIAKVIISTASFVKFSSAMMNALSLSKPECADEKLNNKNDKNNIQELLQFFSKNNIKASSHGVLELFNKKQVHTKIYDKNDIKSEILQWI